MKNRKRGIRARREIGKERRRNILSGEMKGRI